MHLQLSLFLTTLTLTLPLTTASPAPFKGRTIIASPGTLPPGSPCTATIQCSNNAACFSLNSATPATCGSFQASCFSNVQCASNICQNGLCTASLVAVAAAANASSAATGASMGNYSVTATAVTTTAMATGAKSAGEAVIVRGVPFALMAAVVAAVAL